MPLRAILQPILRNQNDAALAEGWAAANSNEEDDEMATFLERMIREGDFTGQAASATITPAAGAINTIIASTAAYNKPGKVLWAETVEVSADKASDLQYWIIQDGSARFDNVQGRLYTSGGVPLMVPYKGVLRPYAGSTGVSLYVRQMLSAVPGTDTLRGEISIHGYEITDDLDYSAPKVIMPVGDSTFATTGPTKKSTHWPFMFKSLLRSTYTKRARLVFKSRSGTNTAEHNTFCDAGWHDIDQVDLCIYNLGLNDAAQSVASATFTANALTFWDWYRTRYPNGKMIVCGPTPMENNTWEGFGVQYRAAMPTAIAARPADQQARLKFIDLGSSFDRTVSSNYVGTDTPGSRLHPNDQGNAAVSTVFNAGYAALVAAGFDF